MYKLSFVLEVGGQIISVFYVMYNILQPNSLNSLR